MRRPDAPSGGGAVRSAPGKTSGRANRYGVVLLLASLLALVSALTYLLSCPLPRDSGKVAVFVEPGSSTTAVAESLSRKGVIRSPLAFRLLSRIMGADGRLQSGEYEFEPGIYAWDAITSLVQGRVVYYSLTVREGLTVEQIALLIEDRGFGKKDAFLKVCEDASLAPDLVPESALSAVRYPLEGYLFPDTYYIRKGMTEKELAQMMLKRFSQVFTKDLQDKAKGVGLSPAQAAALASIVEREAFVPEERSVIAAVYLNRLRISMKLDADPTVAYAMNKEAGYAPLLKDLEYDSLYNTYKNSGLPPGPIGNFGQASLSAVLNPARVDYLYFVAKMDGSHAFARTLSEHNANVALYQGQ